MPQPKAWRKSIKLPVKSAFQILSNVPPLPMIYGIIRRRCLRTSSPVYIYETTSKRELATENQQSIRRGWQFSYADGIPPNHVRRRFSWIVAGTKNHDISARELVQEPFKIAIGRDEDEIIRIPVFQNVSVTRVRARPFRRALSEFGKRSLNK